MTTSGRPLKDILPNVIHSPIRLSILGVLNQVDQIYFSDLKGLIGVSDAELSRQLRVLEQDHIVAISKRRENRKSVTVVSLTEDGRSRFEDYLSELNTIVNGRL
ncbi:transcriptional regulator [Salininema proteolyticum]|uniref:Transcriptional regulator n=1 Tax=Salininema proteolyticum TaxID=1607685 RepID=A0ABV8TWS7_9ACTN